VGLLKLYSAHEQTNINENNILESSNAFSGHVETALTPQLDDTDSQGVK